VGSSYAPVVVFTYNRYDELMQVMSALGNNIGASETDVYVYSNAPIKEKEGDEEAVARIRRELKLFASCFKSFQVIERAVNTGVNGNMIPAVDEIVHRYGRVIVIEDDILTCRGFLSFMNQALDRYEGDKDIFSVCGYNPVTFPYDLEEDTFTYDMFRSWGWGIWADRWDTLGDTDEAVSRIDLRKAHSEAQGYLPAIKSEIVYRKYDPLPQFLDYKLCCQQMADRKTVIYSVHSFCDNIGVGTGETRYEHPPYSNCNFYLDYVNNHIVFSKRKLDVKTNPKYFFHFRDEEYVLRKGLDIFVRKTPISFSVMYYALSLLLLKGYSLGHYFKKHHIRSVAIYDWGHAGRLMYELLRKEGVEVAYILDKKSKLNETDTPLYTCFHNLPRVDAIIATEIRLFMDIEEELYQYTDIPVISMDDIVMECKVDLIDNADKCEGGPYK